MTTPVDGPTLLHDAAPLERGRRARARDLHWPDRFPLLDALRAEPGYGGLRAVVAARAHAVRDALFGE